MVVAREEKDFWSASKQFKKGKRPSTNLLYSVCGVVLTSTDDIVGWWKKCLKDLLNPTDIPSIEEAESGDNGSTFH